MSDDSFVVQEMRAEDVVIPEAEIFERVGAVVSEGGGGGVPTTTSNVALLVTA